MGYSLSMHGVNHAHIVNMLSHVGKKIRHPTPRFAILLEGPWRFHHAMRGGPLSSLGQYAIIGKLQHLAITLGQERLVIKRIDVAHSTLHEQKDDPFGLGSEMGHLTAIAARVSIAPLASPPIHKLSASTIVAVA